MGLPIQTHPFKNREGLLLIKEQGQNSLAELYWLREVVYNPCLVKLVMPSM